MKKLFTFFAAALVALAVNAATINVDPGKGTLATAVTNAQAGDELVLSTGEYTHTDNNTDNDTVRVSKSLTIKAANAAVPVLKLVVTISGGAAVEFQNIKFDGSIAAGNDAHIIYAADATAGNTLSFEGCEFYGFTANNSLIHIGGSDKIDACTINNCYIHNINKSFFFNESTSGQDLTITNSTFANVTTVTSSYYAGLIDTRATSGSLLVDHCTFYNVRIMNTDYAAVGKVGLASGAVVSNCIFMLPATGDSNTRTIRDKVSAQNCLIYNYSTDGGYGTQSNVTKTGCSIADPKFADAANGDFKLSAESPAVNAGTDGKTLGDKRWWPVISYPETDFAAPGYEFTALAATTIGNIKKDTHYGEANPYLRYYNTNPVGTATWKIEATRACYVSATVNMADNSWNYSTDANYQNGKHIFKVYIISEENDTIDYVCEGDASDGYDTYPTVNLPGTLFIPKAGVYTVSLANPRAWSKCGVNSVTLTYVSDVPTIKFKGGIIDNWVEHEATPSEDGLSASYTYQNVTVQDNREFGVVVGNYFRTNGWLYYRADAYNPGVYGSIVPEANTGNMKFHADKAGDYTFTWFYANDSLAITFPDVDRVNGFYLVGYFNGEWKNTITDCTPDKLFELKEGDEYMITTDLVVGDKFKAVYVKGDAINSWYPAGSDNEYLVTEWTAGNKTIYFKNTYQEAWGGHFFIEANEPTVTYSDFEIDLRAGQLGTEGSNLQKYLTVGEPYVYSDEMPIAYNAILNAARFNNAQDPSHGYVNFVATIPVEAGNYKITIGNCSFNSTNGSVKNADGTETLDLIDKNGQTITAIETPKNCYHQKTTENVTSVWFVAEAPQTIQIVCPQYAPYIKVEQVAEVPEEVIVYNVTFANAEDATGVLPANLENIAPTTAITLPKNFSMYKEGYTFDGWTDGEDVYDPGFEYEVTDDVTFTAVYAENNTSLASRTEAVTIKWEFSQSKGVAPINVSGATTFVVAQATIGEEKIDVKLPIDATAGKFVNSANSWTQINPGVIFSIPSAEDAVITYKQYDAGAVTTPEINVSETDATYQLVAAGTSGQLYYEYVQVVLPKPMATSISNTEISSKAQKLIENGQIVIIKNGVKYNVLGACLK